MTLYANLMVEANYTAPTRMEPDSIVPMPEDCGKSTTPTCAPQQTYLSIIS